MQSRFPLTLLPDRLAVCRLGPDDDAPAWADTPPLASVTRTAQELSVVCAEQAVPADVKAERGWRAFRLEGPVPFTTVGVVAGLTKPLAEAGVPVFILSTFDTDYLLVKEANLERARKVLVSAGFLVSS